MTDTPPEIERMVREKIMARTGEERFVMGAQMFDAAREMMCASFPPDLPQAEWKHRLFEHLYGGSLSPALVREKPDKSYGSGVNSAGSAGSTPDS
jgi:hypothetical protein